MTKGGKGRKASMVRMWVYKEKLVGKMIGSYVSLYKPREDSMSGARMHLALTKNYMPYRYNCGTITEDHGFHPRHIIDDERRLPRSNQRLTTFSFPVRLFLCKPSNNSHSSNGNNQKKELRISCPYGPICCKCREVESANDDDGFLTRLTVNITTRTCSTYASCWVNSKPPGGCMLFFFLYDYQRPLRYAKAHRHWFVGDWLPHGLRKRGISLYLCERALES